MTPNHSSRPARPPRICRISTRITAELDQAINEYVHTLEGNGKGDRSRWVVKIIQANVPRKYVKRAQRRIAEQAHPVFIEGDGVPVVPAAPRSTKPSRTRAK